MPYGDLVAQRVQQFETLGDLDGAAITLEEREEYEPRLAAGLRGLHGGGLRGDRVGYHVEEVGRPSFEDLLAGL
jgi:predicted GTPase